MLFNLPKEKDRNLLYELYYIHGVCFGKLMGPKDLPAKVQQNNCVQQKKVLTPTQLGAIRTGMRGK